MTVLVVGGNGHTGAAIVRGLRARGLEARAGTRHPKREGDVRFDWSDESTFAPALDGVKGVYLIAPPAHPDPAPVMTSLIAQAKAARFVLLSSSAIPSEAPGLGEVERYLGANTNEWAVLKPSWFMQNFLDPEHLHARTLRDEKKVYTSTGDAKIAFVDAEDIAAVAVSVFANERAPNEALVITGPEALSYGDVARLMDAEHVNISDDQARARLVASGLNDRYAELLVYLDTQIRAGSEDRVTDTVLRFTGRSANPFSECLRAASRVPAR